MFWVNVKETHAVKWHGEKRNSQAKLKTMQVLTLTLYLLFKQVEGTVNQMTVENFLGIAADRIEVITNSMESEEFERTMITDKTFSLDGSMHHSFVGAMHALSTFPGLYRFEPA